MFKTTAKFIFIVYAFFFFNCVWAQTSCLTAPPLPTPGGNIVTVSSVSELESAVANLVDNTTILIRPGTYNLTTTLYIKNNNITIRGESDLCDSVELLGKGMENSDRGAVGSGIWINSNNVTVANMTISEVYWHPIQIQSSAGSPRIHNVRMLNAGEQFVKASSGGFGAGVDSGIVEYSIMEYTDSAPITDHGGGTGYTNGVDVHGGDGWLIRNNVFKNFHTPDSADHLWNPAILMWNGASNTISENNLFINVDRAIAYGLANRTTDHQGGIIRNNMIYMSSGLYSQARTAGSDATIIVWNSPNTKVLHNSIRTNGNLAKSIELRFLSASVEVANNVTDTPIVYREGLFFLNTDNYTNASAALFINESQGDLRIKPTATAIIDKGSFNPQAAFDIDGDPREIGGTVDLGADELISDTPPTTGPKTINKILPALLYILDSATE